MPSGSTTSPATGRAASEQLERLRRGEITLDEYLDFRADEGVRHLKGLISDEQLELVRETIRDHAEMDPVFVELIRRATGLEPSGTR